MLSIRARIQLLGEVVSVRMPLIAQVAQLAFSSGNWSGCAGSVACCAMHLGFIDLGMWKLASLTPRKVDPSTISPFVLSSSGKYKEPKMASKTI